MKPERELKLQAYFDGELSPRQARKLEQWAGPDPQAQALLDELRMTKAFLSGHDSERVVPESREFYWSRIQRSIERQTQADPLPFPSPFWAWRRYLAPLAGGALAILLAVAMVQVLWNDGTAQQLAQVENLSEHATSFSFRSQSGNMFFVWLQEVPDNTPADLDLLDFLEDERAIQ